MSHHLDTPLAAQTGQLYLDDLYVFPGQGSTVFVMGINSNVNGLHSEPGFHPEARYEFKVHVDGAEFETLTYRVSFSEPDSDRRQALQLRVLTGDQARQDSAAGDLVLQGRTGETASASGTRLWAGASPTPSTSTCRYWPSSTAQWPAGQRLTCPGGGQRARRTASPTPLSTRSCWRSPTSTRNCGPVPVPACGAPLSSPPTPAAGGRSTWPGTR